MKKYILVAVLISLMVLTGCNMENKLEITEAKITEVKNHTQIDLVANMKNISFSYGYYIQPEDFKLIDNLGNIYYPLDISMCFKGWLYSGENEGTLIFPKLKKGVTYLSLVNNYVYFRSPTGKKRISLNFDFEQVKNYKNIIEKQSEIAKRKLFRGRKVMIKDINGQKLIEFNLTR